MISYIKDIFRSRGFRTAEINGLTLGTHDPHKAGLWKRMRRGGFEVEETKLLEEVLPQCGTFIDIGAHIGYYSCLARKVNPNIYVLSFEPNKTNFKSLKKNFEINHIQGKCFNAAVGHNDGWINLYGGDSSGTVNETCHANLPKRTGTVKMIKLDHFNLLNMDRVFIKIDVEAFEYEVLLGAKEFIKKVRPVGMLIEINEGWEVGRNPHYEKTFELLKELGYVSKKVGENHYFTPVENLLDS